MALAPRLELRQGQGLVITPQLQQAIKLLQLSNIELDAFVEAELERNPLLVRDEDDSAPEPEHDYSEAAPEGVADHAASADLDAPGEDATPGQSMTDEAPAGGAIDWSRAGSGGSFEGDGEGFEARMTRELTLAEHLENQLAICGLQGPDRAIAQLLIGSIDEAGYLRGDLDDMAVRLGCGIERVEAALKVVQGFEPTGIAARDVRECLALQLAEKNRLDPAMAALLDNLELVAKRDLAQLRKLCGVDEEDLRDMLSELRALTPKPGAAFGGEPATGVTPDVHVREGAGGMWLVELNADTLPRVLVDQRYHARISGGARSDSDKMFVSECMSSANWLVKSLDQRAKTILKVSSEIVRQQDGFLAFGVEHLRPLNLKVVADAIGMHESTVSRVTSNKYMSTPRGVFELKFFFTAAIASSAGGEAHSAESVRHRIKTLIEGEKSEGEVLSDDRIVELMQAAGIDIARRTVAKYREAMRIPSSVERRRLLKEAAYA